MVGTTLPEFCFRITILIAKTYTLILVASILQALLFGLVLPRIKVITFAQVTIRKVPEFLLALVLSSELGKYICSEEGLQGGEEPDYLSSADTVCGCISSP